MKIIPTLRIFTCHACDHRMRLSHALCGNCFVEKSFFQRRATVLVFTGLMVLLIAALSLM